MLLNRKHSYVINSAIGHRWDWTILLNRYVKSSPAAEYDSQVEINRINVKVINLWKAQLVIVNHF